MSKSKERRFTLNFEKLINSLYAFLFDFNKNIEIITYLVSLSLS